LFIEIKVYSETVLILGGGEERNNRWHRYRCLFTISLISTLPHIPSKPPPNSTLCSGSRLATHSRTGYTLVHTHNLLRYCLQY